MNKSIHALVIASSLTLAGAAHAAPAAAAAVHVPPPVTLPAPAVHAGAAVGVGATAAVPRAPVLPPASPQASAHAATTSAVVSGVPAAQKTNANAGAGTAASARAGDADHDLSASSGVAASLDAPDTVQEIRHATFATRDTVNTRIQTRLEASTQAVARLEARASQADEHSRAALARALVEVRAREKVLRASLRDSVKAANESSWGAAQAALAANYGDYAKAVADAEAGTRVSGPGGR